MLKLKHLSYLLVALSLALGFWLWRSENGGGRPLQTPPGVAIEAAAGDAAAARSPVELWNPPIAAPGAPQSPAATARVSLAGLQRGSELAFPLPGGTRLIGTVTVTSVDADGTQRVGGELTGARPGVFLFYSTGGSFAGSVMLPAEGIGYSIAPSPAGTGSAREVRLTEIVCLPLPREPLGAVLQASPENAPVPVTPPNLSSRPTAASVLYLDFDGETVSNAEWTIFNGGQPIVAAPSTLTQSGALEVWRRVSEDFNPFDIDVTTDPSRYAAAAVGRRMRVIITATDTVAPGSGGTAYMDSFAGAAGSMFSDDVPAWVFNTTAANIAEAASHELGHTLGLMHDGDTAQPENTAAREYYGGHGSGGSSWGPIMGAPYGRSFTQWSRGEYTGATNTEDDLAILAGPANGFGYVADEAGDTPGSARPFSSSGTTVFASGRVTTAGDLDYVGFSTVASGSTQFSLQPIVGRNLDIQLRLLGSDGTVIASSPKASAGTVQITRTLAAGTYAIEVNGVATGDPLANPPTGYTDYGSIGAYTINGSVNALAPTVPEFTSLPPDRTIASGGSVNFTASVSGHPAPTFRWERQPQGSSSWVPLSDDAVFSQTATANLAVAGIPYDMNGDQFRLVATNVAGSATSAPATLTVTAGLPVFTVWPRTRTAATGASLSTAVEVSSATPVTFAWRRNGSAIGGATGSTLNLPTAGLGDGGVYQVVATNEAGSANAYFHVNVIPADLAVTGWGTMNSAPFQPPAGLGDLASVAAGAGHVVALQTDGTVAAWGLNQYGQGAVPAGLAGVAAVSAGGNLSLALRSNGTVAAWGDSNSQNVPAGVTDIIAIAAGDSRGFAVRADGTVWRWGANNNATIPTGLRDVVRIAASSSHQLALKADGTVVAWGNNAYGQADVPAGLSGVAAVAVGEAHSLALKSDGTVVAWGANNIGQATVPAGLNSVIAVASGGYNSFALKSDGSVVAWGVPVDGQSTVPQTLADIRNIFAGSQFAAALHRAIAPGIGVQPVGRTINVGKTATFTVAATGTGTLVYQWRRDGAPLANGANISGATGPVLVVANAQAVDSGTYSVVVTNNAGEAISNDAVLTVATPPVFSTRALSRVALEGQAVSLTVAATGTGSVTYAWKRNGQPIAGATGSTLHLAAVGLGDSGFYEVTATDAGGGTAFSVCYLTVGAPGASPVTWGGNRSVPPAGLPGLVQLAVGSGEVVGLAANGTVVAWGNYSGGPAMVPAGLSGVARVSSNGTGSAAVKTDGTVVLWGNVPSPLPAAGVLTNVVDVALAPGLGAALRADGTVVVWGGNAQGQANVPAGLDDAVAVDVAVSRALVLRSDGTVLAWGSGSSGEATVPAGLSGVKAISVGESHNLALRSDGTVFAWGLNYADSTVVPAGLNQVVEIAAAGLWGVALRSNGTAVAWGRPYEGQTVVPSGPEPIVSIAAGGWMGAALVRTAAPAITQHPAAQSVAAGADVSFTGAASGTAPVGLQWRRNGVNLSNGGRISGATTATLNILDVTGDDAGTYTLAATNLGGTAVSNGASLVVAVPPTVTARSHSKLVNPGQPLNLSVTVAEPGVTYEWRHNGRVLSGETGPTLSRPSAGFADAGYYTVTATDADAAAFSVFIVRVSPVAVGARRVIAWGDSDPNGRTVVPDGLTDIVAVEVSGQNSFAIGEDGRLHAWGAIALPTPPSNVVAVSPGYTIASALALHGDGTVRWYGAGAPADPAAAELRNIVGIAASHHGERFALRVDGTVAGWTPPSAEVRTVPGLSDIVQISEKFGFLMALRADGTVAVLGSNVFGSAVVPPGLSGVVEVSAAANFGLARRGDGSVVVIPWPGGSDNFVPSAAGNSRATAATGYHSLALQGNGTLVGWGNYIPGRPYVLPPGLGPVLSMAAGFYHDLAIVPYGVPVVTVQPVGQSVERWSGVTFTVVATSAGSYRWRRNGVDLANGGAISGADGPALHIADAQPGDQGSYDVVVSNELGAATSNAASLSVVDGPLAITSRPPNLRRSVGETATFAVTAAGSALSYQWKRDGRILVGETGPSLTLTNLKFTDGGLYEVVVSNASGSRISLARLAVEQPAQLWASGRNDQGQATVPAGITSIVQIAAGWLQSAAVKGDGTVVMWGQNDFGELTVPAGLGDVIALSAALNHTLGLRRDGTVAAWGRNTSGQATVPAGLQNVVAIAAGTDHNLALKSDGTVVAWGSGEFGKTTVPSSLTRVIGIAVGSGHSMALRDDGTLALWGSNAYGQASAPAGLADVVAISAAESSSIALTRTGTVSAWGFPFNGFSSVPSGLTGVVSFSHTSTQIAALKGDGTVVAWGGSGTGTGQSTVPAGLGAGVRAISVGDGFTMAIQSDRRVFVWGFPNNSGTVLEPTGAVAIAEGAGHHLVASEVVPSAPAIAASPRSQLVAPGGNATFSVSALGTGTLSYRWRLNGVDIPGATGPTFTVENAGPAEAGAYEVLVSSQHGTTRRVFALGIAANGTVRAWGDNAYGQTEIPLGLTDNVASVASGVYHSIALRTDGTVVAWGRSDLGQASVPGALGGVVSIAAGMYHNLALRTDGTVVAWGSNAQGQASPPSGLSDVVAVAAGASHSLALRSDGSIVAWGDNSFGQGAVPAGAADGAIAVAAGGFHNLVLRSDGTVSGWGRNEYLQAVPPSWLTGVRHLQGGALHSVAVRLNGTVVAWGWDAFGQAQVPSGLGSVVSIAARANHNMATRANGTVVAWGWNAAGQSTVPPGLGTVVAVSAGSYHNVATIVSAAPSITSQPANRTVVAETPAVFALQIGSGSATYQWQVKQSGESTWSNVGDGTTYPGSSLVYSGSKTANLTVYGPAVATESGDQFRCIVTNSVGSTISNAATLTVTEAPPSVSSRPGSRRAAVGGSASFTVTATGNGLGFVWKRNGAVIEGANGFTLDLANVTASDHGYYEVLVSNSGGTVRSVFHLNVGVNGRLVAWGDNAFGQTTIPAGLDGNIVSVASGVYHSIALKTDGTVVAWGRNDFGQTDVPAGLNNVVSIAAGMFHNLALKSDGKVVAWGRNDFNQAKLPIGLAGVVAVSAGFAHNVVLKSDGSVDAWGDNTYDQADVPAGLQAAAVSVTAGGFHSLVLKSDGTIAAWGRNEYAQAAVPAGLTGVKALQGGSLHSVALKTNGAVVAWGWNVFGQGELPSGGVEDAAAIAARANHNVAVLGDGSLAAWGWNANGQSSIPGGLGAVRAISTGTYHNVATVDLPPPAAPAITGHPASRSAVAGTTVQLSVTATGWPALEYRWRKGGVDVTENSNRSGVDTATLTLANLQPSDEGNYDVVVTNTEGTATSGAASLTVHVPPTINFRPLSQRAAPGGSVTFAVNASGGGLDFAWKRNGVVIEGATGSNLNLSNLSASDGGYYESIVSNSGGSIRSVFHLDVSTSGNVAAWGDNAFGQTSIPAGLSGNIATVSSGVYHSIALKTDGTVVAWGRNDFGQTDVPAGLDNVVGVAAGMFHNLALKSDGTVVAWGRNDFGQGVIPAGLAGVVNVSAGFAHNIVLKSDGSIVAWGDNLFGQGSVPAGMSATAVSVTAGGFHNLVLKSDGTVAAWGRNEYGQGAVPAGLSGVKALQGGSLHSVALKANGSLVVWGWNGFGQGELPADDVPGAAAISARANHNVALLSNGSLAAWGWNANGQSTVPTGLGTVRAISAGTYHNVAIVQPPPVPPDVTVRPLSRLAAVGGSASFTVNAAGSSLTYEWRRNGQPISGATAATLEFPSVGAGDAGPYEVLVRNSAGAAARGVFHLYVPVNGTVVAWGDNGFGQAAIPAGLSGNVASVASGVYHSVALKTDGTVVAWGGNGFGQTDVPSGLTGVVSVSAGMFHSVALKGDGTVVAWGRNDMGQAGVPAGLSNVVAISAGFAHNLALKADGSIVAWGDNGFGQAVVPGGLSNGAVNVTAGGFHNLVLKSDGTVAAWGRNEYGQAAAPAGLTGVMALQGGSLHSLALKTDGAVVVWGWDAFGQGRVPAELSGATAIASRANHNLALKSDGSVTAWGWNTHGQASVPAGLGPVLALSAGTYHNVATVQPSAPLPAVSSFPLSRRAAPGSAASFSVSASGSGLSYAWKRNGQAIGGAGGPTLELASVTASDAGNYEVLVTNAAGTVRGVFHLNVGVNGALAAWGDNAFGQTNIPAGLGGSVSSVASGVYHSVALKTDGTVVAWGRNDFGQTDVPSGLTNVVSVTAGMFHNLAVKGDGSVVAWGRNDAGQSVVPAWVGNVVAASAGLAHNIALKSDGTVVAWGDNAFGQSFVPAGLGGTAVAVSAGAFHNLVLKSDGTVAAWGRNEYGQASVPAGLSGVKTLQAGSLHSAALKADGTVVAWGWDAFGQGQVPAGLANVAALSTRANHNLALRSNGAAVAWGWNGNGQANIPSGLGPILAISAGTYHNVATVQPPPESPNVTSRPRSRLAVPGGSASFSLGVSGSGLTYAWKRNGQAIPGATGSTLEVSGIADTDAGHYEGFATNSGGTVRSVFHLGVSAGGAVAAWGDNAFGQANVPAGLADAVASLSSGVYHSVALKSDGTVAAWGRNDWGQSAVPAGLSDVVQVAAGMFHNLALKGDGTVVAWGRNDSGQGSVPAGLSGVVAVAAGFAHNLALKGDGTIVAWGDNAFGQVDVPGGLGSTAVAVTAGAFHNLVLKSDGTIVAWGRNEYGQASAPDGLEGVKSLQGGTLHSVALKSDGTVVAWGWNGLGQSPAPDGLASVAISARANHNLALRSDGSVAAWGWNANGQSTVPAGLGPVLSISSGSLHNAVIVPANE